MAHFLHDYIDKIVAKDWKAAADYWADDVVFHQSGHGKWSGTRKGKAEALAWLRELTATLDSMDMEHHALTMGDGHGVALMRVHATKGDESYHGNRLAVYHLDDSKITEIWTIDEDQAAMEAFFG